MTDQPTTEDDAYANEVEQAARVLAEMWDSTCFKPLHDDENGFRARQEWRRRARVVLDAAEHRALWDEMRKVNSRLRLHGIEYPLGARGVDDALGQLAMRLNDTDYLRDRLADLAREELGITAEEDHRG